MIAHEIIGDALQAAVVTLAAGDEIRAEAAVPFSRLADCMLAARKGDREDVKRDFGGTFGAPGDLIGGDT